MPRGHAKATVGDIVIAETETWEEVEGNVYFPPASVKTEYFEKTDLSTHCPWKGDASYYTIKAGGTQLRSEVLNSCMNMTLTDRAHVSIKKTKSGRMLPGTTPRRVSKPNTFATMLPFVSGNTDLLSLHSRARVLRPRCSI